VSRLVAGFDPALAELCAGIPYQSTGTVVLSYPRRAVAHPLQGSGFVVPRAERNVSIMAGSWISSKWPDRAPEGRVLLRAFVGGARDPLALTQTDDELVTRSHHDLASILDIDDTPTWSRVYRWDRANAQHEVGHLDRLRRIDERLARWSGLFVTGSGFRGVGIPDCVADGRATGVAAARHS
jgi:oxygen-dependent protoporphyrinogen oxidase